MAQGRGEGGGRRRYTLHHDALDSQIEALVAAADEQFGPLPSGELLRQMLVTTIALGREAVPVGDLTLINSALKELRHSFRVFEPYRAIRKVSVFGSARTTPEAAAWAQARDFTARMTAEGWMTITGGGGGIMHAAQQGAGRDASFAVNIHLPFEQRANPVIAGDPKLINFRYFFSRKVTFVKESHAIALLPGGFGTHDEGMEALTLIQTGKSEILPVIFIDEPGGDYWRSWETYVRRDLCGRGLISEADLSLFRVTDDVDEAVSEILAFYRNYHSSRYVGDRLIMRLCERPSDEQLEELNAEFGDLSTRGRIEVCEPLPQEEGQVSELPRITLRFNRRLVGRLREMIDRLNDFAPAPAERPAASPHEIVAVPLSQEELRRRDDL